MQRTGIGILKVKNQELHIIKIIFQYILTQYQNFLQISKSNVLRSEYSTDIEIQLLQSNFAESVTLCSRQEISAELDNSENSNLLQMIYSHRRNVYEGNIRLIYCLLFLFSYRGKILKWGLHLNVFSGCHFRKVIGYRASGESL